MNTHNLSLDNAKPKNLPNSTQPSAFTFDTVTEEIEQKPSQPKAEVRKKKPHTLPPRTRKSRSPSPTNLRTSKRLLRQYTFVTRKKRPGFLDDSNSSSGSEEATNNLKRPDTDLYYALTAKLPKNRLKVTKDNAALTTIEAKSFRLTLINEEISAPLNPAVSALKSQKVRSNSIMESMLRHLVGNKSESPPALKKQMSMRYPIPGKECFKPRPSLFGFLKGNKVFPDSSQPLPSQEPENNEPPSPTTMILNEDRNNDKMKSQLEIEITPLHNKHRESEVRKVAAQIKGLEDLSEKNSAGLPSKVLGSKGLPATSPKIIASRKKLAEMREKLVCTDFTLEDFLALKKEIEREKQILEDEIKNVTQNKYTNVEMKLKGKFVEKWTRAKWNIKAAARMRRLNDDIKCYGSSFNMSGIQHKIATLESLFMRQKTLSEKLSHSYVFMPYSGIRAYWSYVVIFLLIYTSYITPYRVAFVDNTSDHDVWFFVETTIDVLFFFDILITLNSAFVDEKGHLITNRCQIFAAYLKTWLILDIIGIFPFYLLDTLLNDSEDSGLSFSDNYNDLLKFLRLPRLYRLIRIARLVKFIKKAKALKFIEFLQDFMSAGTIKILQFVFTISICVHIMGCLWFFVAKIKNMAPDTWVANLGMIDNDNFSMYLTSIYFAFATLTTVGFGDIHAYNEIEYLLAMVWMIFGAGFYSFTLGSLSSLLTNLDTRKTHLVNKLMLMDEFCKENKFPRVLKTRVKKALEYASVKSIFSSDDKNQLLSEIPTDLRFEIAEFMFSGLSTRIPFFKNKDKCFIANFVPLLKPLKVLHGELIYRKEEFPNLIYFLYQGRVNYVVGPQNIVFKSLVEGSYFGEIEIYENHTRYFSCRAEQDCDLLTIPGDQFVSMMRSFPENEVEIRRVIIERKKRNEIALEKIKSIAPISINSEFWKKKKDVNLYDAVKMKRLRKNKTLHIETNVSESINNDGGSKVSKIKRFFTNMFSRSRTSLKKLESQEPESDNNLTPIKNPLNPPPPPILENDELPKNEETGVKSPSLITPPYNPKSPKGLLRKSTLKHTNVEQRAERDLADQGLNSNKPFITEEEKSEDSNSKSPKNRKKVTIISPADDPLHSKEERERKESDKTTPQINLSNLTPEVEFNRHHEKKWSILSPSHKRPSKTDLSVMDDGFKNPSDHEQVVTSENLTKSQLPPNSIPDTVPSKPLLQTRKSIRNISLMKTQTLSLNPTINTSDSIPAARKSLSILEKGSSPKYQRDLSPSPNLPKINEIKNEEDELPSTKARSRTETGRKSPPMLNKRESISRSKRKFSAFKNKEINKILASFQDPQLKTKKAKAKRKDDKEKGQISEELQKSLDLLRKNVKDLSNSCEFHEKSAFIVQSQLGQINEYLRIACKRNKIIKGDPYFQGWFLKRNTFQVGQRFFEDLRPVKPALDAQKGGRFLAERMELEGFPEPEQFLLSER